MFSPSIFESLTFAIPEEATNKTTNDNLYDLIADPSFQQVSTAQNQLHPPMVTNQQSSKTNEVRKERESRKVLKNLGKSCISRKGKVMSNRIMKPLTDCRLKCKQRVPSDERVELFQNYCNLDDYDKRAAYISSLFVIENKKTVRPRTDDPEKQKYRVKTHNYYLQLRESRINVCQKCFLTVFDESDNFIKALAQKKIVEEGMDLLFMRGKHPMKDKCGEDKLSEARNHILSFPSESLIGRGRANERKVLPSDLNLPKMFKLYAECTQEPVSYKFYSAEFQKLKLGFKKVKK